MPLLEMITQTQIPSYHQLQCFLLNHLTARPTQPETNIVILSFLSVYVDSILKINALEI